MLLDGKQFCPRDVTGLKHSGIITLGATSTFEPPFEIDKWMDRMIPLTSQGKTNACMAFAVANWCECVIRIRLDQLAFKPNKQINAMLLYDEVMDRKYGGARTGMTLRDGFEVAREIGLLPANAILLEIPNNLNLICQQLMETPLVQGTLCWDQWNIMNSESGKIGDPTSPPPEFSGHATLLCGVHYREGRWERVLANSWGTDWGRYGYGRISDEAGKKYTIGLITALLPRNLTDWRWKDFLVETT